MNNFVDLKENELQNIDGGTLEILFLGKVFTGVAAAGIIGGGVVLLVGVAALAFYVASKN